MVKSRHRLCRSPVVIKSPTPKEVGYGLSVGSWQRLPNGHLLSNFLTRPQPNTTSNDSTRCHDLSAASFFAACKPRPATPEHSARWVAGHARHAHPML